MRPTLTRIVLLTAVVALTGCAPPNLVDTGRAALGLPTSGSQAQYQNVVRQVWASTNRMNMTNDAGQLNSFETGAPALGDRTLVAGRKAQGVGPALSAPLPIKSSTVWVPAQSGYPAHLLALVNSVDPQQGGPLSYFFDLVRASQKGPWKIDDSTVLTDPNKKPPVSIDGERQATQLSATGSTGLFAVDPGQMSKAYEQFFADTGNQQSYSGPFTQDAWSEGTIQNQVASASMLASAGATVNNAIAPVGGTEVWGASGGAAVVFFHVAIVQLVAATPGRLNCIIQQGNGQGSYDYALPPGQYSQAEFDSLYTIAALDPRKGGGKVKVLGGMGAVVKAAGSPATSCS